MSTPLDAMNYTLTIGVSVVALGVAFLATMSARAQARLAEHQIELTKAALEASEEKVRALQEAREPVARVAEGSQNDAEIGLLDPTEAAEALQRSFDHEASGAINAINAALAAYNNATAALRATSAGLTNALHPTSTELEEAIAEVRARIESAAAEVATVASVDPNVISRELKPARESETPRGKKRRVSPSNSPG